LEYRRFPVAMGVYEAMSDKFLTDQVDTMITRWYEDGDVDDSSVAAEDVEMKDAADATQSPTVEIEAEASHHFESKEEQESSCDAHFLWSPSHHGQEPVLCVAICFGCPSLFSKARRGSSYGPCLAEVLAMASKSSAAPKKTRNDLQAIRPYPLLDGEQSTRRQLFLLFSSVHTKIVVLMHILHCIRLIVFNKTMFSKEFLST
jgi:hypothetical protein